MPTSNSEKYRVVKIGHGGKFDDYHYELQVFTRRWFYLWLKKSWKMIKYSLRKEYLIEKYNDLIKNEPYIEVIKGETKENLKDSRNSIGLFLPPPTFKNIHEIAEKIPLLLKNLKDSRKTESTMTNGNQKPIELWDPSVTVEDIRVALRGAGKTFREEYEKIRKGTSVTVDDVRSVRLDNAEALTLLREGAEKRRKTYKEIQSSVYSKKQES